MHTLDVLRDPEHCRAIVDALSVVGVYSSSQWR